MAEEFVCECLWYLPRALRIRDLDSVCPVKHTASRDS